MLNVVLPVELYLYDYGLTAELKIYDNDNENFPVFVLLVSKSES